MADKKKQHFVPQFYMRNFAVDPDRKYISLYVVCTEKHVPIAAIKDQAYENFFYGKAGAEDKLSELEGAVAPVIAKIISDNALPRKTSDDCLWLSAFVLFQGARTPSAAAEINESNEQLIRRLASTMPDLVCEASEFQIEDRDIPSMALHIMSDVLPFAQDLRWKLLENKTTRFFITSDNPTVQYNQFLEKRNVIGSNTGIASRGLQIFIPLGPKHLLMLYDGDVYRVGGRRHLESHIEITREDDIKILNALQAANADAVLYFSAGTEIAHVREALELASVHRRSQKVELTEHCVVGPGGDVGNLIQSFKIDLRMGAVLDFCVVLPSAAGPRMSQYSVQLRNPELVQRFEEARLQSSPYHPRQVVESYLSKRRKNP